MNKLGLILIGAGGHARACIDVIEQQGQYQIVGLVSLPEELHSRHLGYAVIVNKKFWDGLPGSLRAQLEEAMVQAWMDNPNYADIHRQGLVKTLTDDMDRGFSLYYCGAGRDVCTSDEMRLAWDAARTGNKVANIQRKR